MTKAVYEFHPLCNLFPEMTGTELESLAEDIWNNGLQQPIARWNKQILDGKHRLAACERAGVAPNFVEWHPQHPEDKEASEKEALAFVLGANLNRRHLTESQRAMIAARVSTASEGRPEKTTSRDVVSQEEAGKRLDVSQKTVNRAASILQNGSAALVSAVDHGQVTVNDAAKIVDQPKRAQDKAVKAVQNGKSKTVTQAVKPREPGDETEFNENAKAPDKISIQRSKTVKTVEALIRAFDDLHGLKPKGRIHSEAVKTCKGLLQTAKEWT